MTPGTPSRFVIAAWAAIIFGLLEGLLSAATRHLPRIRAAYKTSAHIIWITPLFYLVVFLVIAACLPLLWRLMSRWVRGHEARWTAALFVFIGVFAVLDAPGVMYQWSTALLALGVAIAVFRSLEKRWAAP